MARLYESNPGSHISGAASAMVALAKATGETVESDFNGIKLAATSDTTPEQIVATYNEESERRATVSRESAEGKASAARQEEFRRQAEAAKAEGLLPFSVRDQDSWNKDVAANNDGGYGECCLRYAARWAHLMEKRMAAGEKLEDIADKCSHDADTEGITGFMYGCAISCIARAWEHGEALRRWHNIKTQIGTEGEKANESGGVLNPAILSIG